jgi:hypothetical protein
MGAFGRWPRPSGAGRISSHPRLGRRRGGGRLQCACARLPPASHDAAAGRLWSPCPWPDPNRAQGQGCVCASADGRGVLSVVAPHGVAVAGPEAEEGRPPAGAGCAGLGYSFDLQLEEHQQQQQQQLWQHPRCSTDEGWGAFDEAPIRRRVCMLGAAGVAAAPL